MNNPKLQFNLNEAKNVLDSDRSLHDRALSLSLAFRWRKTEQGIEYWDNLLDRMKIYHEDLPKEAVEYIEQLIEIEEKSLKIKSPLQNQINDLESRIADLQSELENLKDKLLESYEELPKNFNRDHVLVVLNTNIATGSRANYLTKSFDWDDTEYGDDYWSEVSRELALNGNLDIESQNILLKWVVQSYQEDYES